MGSLHVVIPYWALIFRRTSRVHAPDSPGISRTRFAFVWSTAMRIYTVAGGFFRATMKVIQARKLNRGIQQILLT